MSKFKDEHIISRLQPLLDVSRANLVFIKAPDFSFVGDKQLEKSMQIATDLLGSAIRAFLQLHSVYEDSLITWKMSRRFPWKKGEIRKSKHLDLVWFQFINQCYLYKEKTKLFANYFNVALKPFGRKEQLIDVASTLKTVDKNLGKQIRARGSSFHEWHVNHSSIYHFTMVELINSQKREIGPLGDVEGHYSDAKFLLGADIIDAISFMESFLITLLDENISVLIDVIQQFNALIESLKTKDRNSERK